MFWCRGAQFGDINRKETKLTKTSCTHCRTGSTKLAHSESPHREPWSQQSVLGLPPSGEWAGTSERIQDSVQKENVIVFWINEQRGQRTDWERDTIWQENVLCGECWGEIPYGGYPMGRKYGQNVRRGWPEGRLHGEMFQGKDASAASRISYKGIQGLLLRKKTHTGLKKSWSWNQAQSVSYCLLYTQSSHNEKWRFFPETTATSGWAMSSQPIIRSHR